MLGVGSVTLTGAKRNACWILVGNFKGRKKKFARPRNWWKETNLVLPDNRIGSEGRLLQRR